MKKKKVGLEKKMLNTVFGNNPQKDPGSELFEKNVPGWLTNVLILIVSVLLTPPQPLYKLLMYDGYFMGYLKIQVTLNI